MADAHGSGLGHAHRNHEAQLRDVDRDLVRGRLVGAQAAYQQRGDDEQATFHQHGDTDRQAGAQQFPDRLPARPFEVREQLQVGEALGEPQVGSEGDRLQPHHHRRGDAEAFGTHFRETELAVGQHIAHRRQHQQAAETQQHGRQRPVHALAQVAHAEVQGQRRAAPAHRMQERGRARHDVRGDAEGRQQRRHHGEEGEHDQAQAQCQPQCLAEQRADLALAASAVQLRYRGGERDQRADRDQHRQPQQGGADGHRGQGRWRHGPAQAAGRADRGRRLPC
ncbi:hypothetical protein G6F57_017402 [Rhizopus arrhizus]|nr:hypothetical protein G6F57_017402 [Rhizopus arrhizus]